MTMTRLQISQSPLVFVIRYAALVVIGCTGTSELIVQQFPSPLYLIPTVLRTPGLFPDNQEDKECKPVTIFPLQFINWRDIVRNFQQLSKLRCGHGSAFVVDGKG